MKETEITVKILEPIKIAKEKIINHGFNLKEKVQMTDYYYSKYSSEILDNFEYSELIKNSFIVREVIRNNNTTVQLIYKDKILDKHQNVISEEKIKCNISSISEAIKIFNCADLNCWCKLEQDMSLYDNGKTCFMVQEIADLGNYIEYEEDQTMSKYKEYEKINIMYSTLKSLDLELGTDFSCKKVFDKFKKL